MHMTLCLDGLPTWMTSTQVADLCTPYGSVQSARVVCDAYGASMNYGFVQMATVEEAEGVVQALDGCDRFGGLLYVARTYPRVSQAS
jgi:RNA recognition motif. (a.k.a. RRM, RBD, or RNP domain)